MKKKEDENWEWVRQVIKVFNYFSFCLHPIEVQWSIRGIIQRKGNVWLCLTRAPLDSSLFFLSFFQFKNYYISFSLSGISFSSIWTRKYQITLYIYTHNTRQQKKAKNKTAKAVNLCKIILFSPLRFALFSSFDLSTT